MFMQSLFKNHLWVWMLSMTILGMASCTGGTKIPEAKTAKDLIIGHWMVTSITMGGQDIALEGTGVEASLTFTKAGEITFIAPDSEPAIGKYLVVGENKIVDPDKPKEEIITIKKLTEDILNIDLHIDGDQPTPMKLKRKK